MRRCAGRKRDGTPCAVSVKPEQTYCWWHDPEHAAERRRIAGSGGRAKALAGTELAQIKRDVREIIAGVLGGRIRREVAAVAWQGYNTLLRACEQERKARETDELAARVEALESDGVADRWP